MPKLWLEKFQVSCKITIPSIIWSERRSMHTHTKILHIFEHSFWMSRLLTLKIIHVFFLPPYNIIGFTLFKLKPDFFCKLLSSAFFNYKFHEGRDMSVCSKIFFQRYHSTWNVTGSQWILTINHMKIKKVEQMDPK